MADFFATLFPMAEKVDTPKKAWENERLLFNTEIPWCCCTLLFFLMFLGWQDSSLGIYCTG